MKAAEEQRQWERDEEKRKAAEKKKEEKRQEREVRCIFIFNGYPQRRVRIQEAVLSCE